MTATTGSGGFAHLKTGTNGALKLLNNFFTNSAAALDGGLVYIGGTTIASITITTNSIITSTAGRNGGAFACDNSGATTVVMSGKTPNNYITSTSKGGYFY